MSKIIAKMPLINWDKEFPKLWNAGNSATTHIFNALPFMFPQGERFFIKVATVAIQMGSEHISS